MKKRRMEISVVALSLLLQPELLWAQECSDRDYGVFKKYDAYLDANPNMLADQARSNYSARLGMRPEALKDLYFRCLIRWKDQEPEAARRVARESLSSMAAGGESPLTKGHSCNTLGYRYGHTAASTIFGKRPNVGWDFVMPERCQNLKSTETGIKAGTNAAAR